MIPRLASILTNSVFISDHFQLQRSRYRRMEKASGFSLRRLLQNTNEPSYNPGYTLSSQFFPFLISLESEKYPVLNTVMEFYRKTGLNVITPYMSTRFTRPLTEEELACLALEQDTFANLLENSPDFDTLNLLLMLKAKHLFGQLQAESGNTGFGS